MTCEAIWLTAPSLIIILAYNLYCVKGRALSWDENNKNDYTAVLQWFPGLSHCGCYSLLALAYLSLILEPFHYIKAPCSYNWPGQWLRFSLQSISDCKLPLSSHTLRPLSAQAESWPWRERLVKTDPRLEGIFVKATGVHKHQRLSVIVADALLKDLQECVIGWNWYEVWQTGRAQLARTGLESFIVQLAALLILDTLKIIKEGLGLV